MASEIRVDKINSLSGVGTVTLSPTGVDIAGITTVATLKATTGIVTTLTATTGIVTTLTANTVTSLGAVSGTTGTFSGAVSGTTGTFSAAVSGTTGTFSSDVKSTAGIVDIRSGSSINTNVTGGSASGTLQKNTTSGEFAIVSGGSGGNNYLTFHTSASAAPTEKLRIHADGEVEIKEAAAGQTVLSATALYSSSSNVDIATFARSGGAVSSAIRYADATTSMLFGTTTSHKFGVMTGGTERLSIDSSGRMSLGTTDASQFNAGADDFVIQGSGSCGITIDATSSSNSNIYFADGPTGSEAYRGYTQYQHSNDTFVFGRAGVDHLYLQNDGGTKNVLGNFIVGASGRGLQFNASDSGSSELLDDYEEGTWTPTNSIGLTLTNSNPAYYLKIGKMVMIQFDVSFSGASDTSQCGAIQSLPFTAENTTNHFAQSPLPYISQVNNQKLDTSLENLLLFIAPGDDKITIYSWVTSSLAARSLLVGRRIRHQMIYKAA